MLAPPTTRWNSSGTILTIATMTMEQPIRISREALVRSVNWFAQLVMMFCPMLTSSWSIISLAPTETV